MRLIIKTRRIEVTRSVKNAIPKKFLKFEKWIPESSLLELTMSHERGSKGGRDKKAIINVDLPHYKMIHLEEVSDDIMSAIDNAQKRLEIKLHKFRDMRMETRKRDVVFKTLREAFVNLPRKITGKKVKSQGTKIVKRKYFSVKKPISEKEAIEQMKLLGHDFYVFTNIRTNKISIVYRRRDKNFGVIECV